MEQMKNGLLVELVPVFNYRLQLFLPPCLVIALNRESGVILSRAGLPPHSTKLQLGSLIGLFPLPTVKSFLS